ncbi:DUF4169 family protein [Sphingomonas sp. AOB5]|uniref:DUF4169 family protein n=1 Tax=Sphingomonas sp. AOB5 TaxID=3034017 RepID=UPI0023F73BD0|nr:DUF4169 family protein [Sphingomonas sp. AOB5]MDF7774245.1 DUF4169 family protein [Sphingomonas sp. AOB5]
MAEIINLNKARKARAKAANQAKAVENRARFGRTKVQKQADGEQYVRIGKLLDESKREEAGREDD